MNKLKLSIIFLFSFCLFYCSNNQPNNNDKKDENSSSVQNTIDYSKLIKIDYSKNKKDSFVIGNKIDFSITIPDTVKFDSLRFSANDVHIKSFTQSPYSLQFSTEKSKVGTNTFTASIYKNGFVYKSSIKLMFLSDLKPVNYTYKIIKTYYHDPEAYTQGLVYTDNIFYEATGLEGHSTLRKTQLENGQVIQSFTIPEKYFGEGITIFDNKIIQLSWQNNTGFVYDKESFQLLQKFNYSTEGWGITHDGQKLIMSDGSNKLYFLESQSFSQIGEIEVYDNIKAIVLLNELEFIEGKIYANIYQSDVIAIINPTNGKVEGYIHLDNLLPKQDRTKDTDVLNGIAYDTKNKRLFVTGKKWSKLFEIQLIKKQ